MSNGALTETLARAYQLIITELEIPRAASLQGAARERSWYTIQNTEYIVTRKEIVNLLQNRFGSNAQGIFNELVKRGFLLPLSNTFHSTDDILGYRSLHMDLLIRSSEIRTAFATSRYLLSSRLAFSFVPTPTRDDRGIQADSQAVSQSMDPLSKASRDLREAIITFFEGRWDLAQKYINITKRFVEGLDAYQALALTRLLRSEKKVHVLEAPTGSGKTEIFLLYTLAWLIRQRYIYKDDRSRVLLVYPRKALTADQASRIIKLLDVSSSVGFPFTFAIRDGDTPRREDLARGASTVRFRGVECPRCRSELLVQQMGGDYFVVCNSCKVSFKLVKVTRDQSAEADIVATNQWALEVRLLDSNRDDINVRSISEVGLIVIDEAHEYTGLGGGLFNTLLEAIKYVRSIAQKKEDLKLILSSATIPHASSFASKLTGVDENSLQVISYYDVGKVYGENAISGRRLVILGLFSMNPQFSWNTYCQLWLVLTTFLACNYELRRADEPSTATIQSVLFVNNIRELKRVRSGFLNNLSLGEPKDHLEEDLPVTNPYCYWHFIPPRHRARVKLEVKDLKWRDKMENKLAMMLSELDVNERTQNISRLRRNEDLAVISTSSLELGVDYRSVMFILNSGLENPISLLQRIGRGGRSVETMRTVLGIVLARPNIAEAFLLYNRDYLESLMSMRPSTSHRLFVTVDNPQVKERGRLTKAIASLALKGEHTYASKRAIEDEEQAVELFRKILDELRKPGDP